MAHRDVSAALVSHQLFCLLHSVRFIGLYALWKVP
nr:MAG TPA: hypothetical protein [Caudoviricetes sp.]